MVREAFIGFGWFVLYYVIAASLLIALRILLKPPRELFRKMLHMACVLSILVLLNAFSRWYLAAGAALLFAVVVYPAIRWLERFPRMMEMLVQRKDGEIRLSLLIVFLMMAVLIVIFWGVLGASWKFIILAAVMAWGLGDAAAALVGKHFGKHHFPKVAGGKKTLEGSLAMLLVAAAALFLTLLSSTALPWSTCLMASLIVALAASAVELISGAGTDTITVPLVTAVSLYCVLMALTNGGGV